MKKTFLKKIIAASTITFVFLQMLYFVVEPNTVVAATTNDSIIVTLNVTAGISISNGADSTMAPNIGIAANKSIGGSSWTVSTNSYGGYFLTVAATQSPALKNGSTDSFADYTEASAGTPDTWGNVASGTKEFGFSANGTNVNTTTWGTATTCGSAGAADVLGKYRGFTSTTPITIANRTTMTTIAGDTTNICFAAEQNGVYAANGNYTATITGTATTQ